MIRKKFDLNQQIRDEELHVEIVAERHLDNETHAVNGMRIAGTGWKTSPPPPPPYSTRLDYLNILTDFLEDADMDLLNGPGKHSYQWRTGHFLPSPLIEKHVPESLADDEVKSLLDLIMVHHLIAHQNSLTGRERSCKNLTLPISV